MILNVYCYYNKLLNAFGNFQLDDHTPEQVVASLSRDLRAQVIQKKVENLRYIDLYCLGQFDDEKGSFTNDKQLLLDLGSTIAGLEMQLQEKAEPNKEA